MAIIARLILTIALSWSPGALRILADVEQARPGDSYAYVLSAHGDQARRVDLELPPALEPVSIDPTAGTCSIDGQAVHCEAPPEADPVTILLHVRVRSLPCGPLFWLALAAEGSNTSYVKLIPPGCPAPVWRAWLSPIAA